MQPRKATRRLRRLLEPLAEEGWLAVHGVSTGRGTIDTVLVGPGGLLTVGPTSHRGRISDVHAQRRWLELITGRTVDALLVSSRRAAPQEEGVVVLPAPELPRHLRHRHRELAEADIRALHERLTYAFAA